jgi:hypothetical protein
MSYTFLQEAGEEFSAECFSDIPACVLSRLNLTAEKSCSPGKETESCLSSPSGTTFATSTGNLGAGMSMSSAEGSPAKTSVPQEGEQESKVSEAGFGVSSLASLAKYDPGTHSLKTLQTLLFEGCTESLLILPKWGWMRDGECFQLAPLVRHMCDDGCSLWPTPRADGRDNAGGSNARKQAQRRGTYIGRYPNPILIERLMAWPTSWTDLLPLETDKFQQWSDSHGGF